MPTLIVLPISEAFGTLWPQLAREVGADLRIAASPGDFPRAGEGLPPILVIAGSEGQAAAEVRALATAGHHPIVVGAERDHRFAITLLRSGAADYFALPEDLESLRSAVAAAAEVLTKADMNGAARPSQAGAYDFGLIVGVSPALRATLEKAARIIPHAAASVLLTGETGTGKELLARAVHFNGPRSSGAFVEINCAAIPATLLESELFGYERGAFTDARNPKPGLFEAADRGTLFLDEIGHMPLAVQGKVLKALEEKRIRRLGSVRQQEVDVRIIAATHVELEDAVRAGEFREDLYYRLAVIPLHLPPLRERGADVLLLADHFLDRLSRQYQLAKPHLGDDVKAVLVSHLWPGNVRELRNALERALLLGDGRLYPADLFMSAQSRVRGGNGPIAFPAPLADIERQAARAMLELHAGNKSAAAAALEISRSRLYRLLGETEEGEDVGEDAPSPEVT